MVKSFRWLAVAVSTAAGISCGQITYQWTDITPPDGRVFDVGTHPLDGRIIVQGPFTVQGKTAPVMYSNDHGATWNAPDTPLPESAASMFVHVGLPGVVYLEETGSFFQPGPPGPGVFPSEARNGQLYRSADFGRTWSLVHTSAVGEWIHLVASDPLDVLVLQGFECEILKHNSSWILEAENEFYAMPPTAAGDCASGLVPVRRFHNLQSDLNHRWVADDAVAAGMRAQGWYDGGVRFCARPLGSNE